MRPIGPYRVSDIGLGCMHLSIEGRPARDQAIATIHAALDAGVTLYDTADAYHRDAGEHGHNERLLAEAIRYYPGHTDGVVIATKGGHRRPGDGTWTLHGARAELIAAAHGSRERLGLDRIQLYQLHRPDPAVEFRQSLEALRELIDDGVIETAGISNVSVSQINLAHLVLGSNLVSVQNHFSPRFRTSERELRRCEELGIAFLPYRPLGRPIPYDPGTPREESYLSIAQRHNASVQQIALAWELALAPHVIPIPGARRSESIVDSARARSITLAVDEVERLSAV